MLPVLLLGSCMVRAQPASDPDASTLAEARSDLYATLEETQELIGGDWTIQDDQSTLGCDVGDGPGRTYSALRTALPVADPSGAVEAAVEAAWESRGYTVESMQIGPVAQLVGETSGHALLVFRLSDRAMTLQGESECRPAPPR